MFECAGFESMPVGAVDVVNIDSQLPIFGHTRCGNLNRAVCGIVQDLYLEKFARITNLAYSINEPLHHIHLVVNRKLYRHTRLNGQPGSRLSHLVFVSQIQVHEVVTMNTVDREDAQNRQVRDQDENIKGVQLVEPIPMMAREE